MPDQLPEGVTITAGGKRTYTHAFKLRVIERHKAGETAAAMGEELGVHPTHIRQWIRGQGLAIQKPETGFVVTPLGKKVYAESFKKEAVNRLMSGEVSTVELGRELDVRPSLLSAWRREKKSDETITIDGRDYKAEYRKRQQQGSMKPKKKTLTELYSKETLKRIKAGEGPKDIAKELKIDVANIYNWVSNAKKQKQRYIDAGRKGGLAKNKNKSVNKLVMEARGQEETAPILSTRMRDAVSLLKHAKTAMYSDLQIGKIKEFDETHLLVLQALRTLTGGE